MQELYANLAANLAPRLRVTPSSLPLTEASEAAAGDDHERQAATRRERDCGVYLCEALVSVLASSTAPTTFFLQFGGFVVAAEAALRWRSPSVRTSNGVYEAGRMIELDPAECMAAAMTHEWWGSVGQQLTCTTKTTASNTCDHQRAAVVCECSELLTVAASRSGAQHVAQLRQFLHRWNTALQVRLKALAVGVMVNCSASQHQERVVSVEQLLRMYSLSQESQKQTASMMFSFQCWHIVWSCISVAFHQNYSASSSSPLPASGARLTSHSTALQIAVDVVKAYLRSCANVDTAFSHCCGVSDRSDLPPRGSSSSSSSITGVADLARWILSEAPLTYYPSLIVKGLALCRGPSVPSRNATRTLLELLGDFARDPEFLARLVDPLQQPSLTALGDDTSTIAAQSYVVHLVQMELLAGSDCASFGDLQLTLLQCILPHASDRRKCTAIDLEVCALQWLEHAQLRLASHGAASERKEHHDNNIELFFVNEVSLLNAARRALTTAAAEGGGLTPPHNVLLRWHRVLTQWADSVAVEPPWPTCGDSAALQVFVLQSDISLFPRSTGGEERGYSSQCKIPAAIRAASEGASADTPLANAVKTLQQRWSSTNGTGPKRNITWCPVATTASIIVDGWLPCTLTLSQMDLLEYVLQRQQTTSMKDIIEDSAAAHAALLRDYAAGSEPSMKGPPPVLSEVGRTLRSLAPVLIALQNGPAHVAASSTDRSGAHVVVDVSLLPQILRLRDAASAVSKRGATHRSQHSTANGVVGGASSMGEALRAEAFVCRTAKRLGSNGCTVSEHVKEYMDWVRRQWVLFPERTAHISAEALNKRLTTDLVLASLRSQDDSTAERAARDELANAQVSLIAKGYLTISDPAASTTAIPTTDATIGCIVLFVAS
jgi:hypothetical protein